jgi:streptomycin 6-kinase
LITVPHGFGDVLVGFEGEAAQRWRADLPALATRYCARWNLTPDGEVLHGFVAVVLPVRRADGSPAVLKLTWVDAETRHEPLALAVWNGRGVVRLLDHDDEHGALLLERLDHTRSLLDAPAEEAVEVTGGLLRRLRVQAPREVRTLAERAAETADALAERNATLGNVVPAALLETALSHGRELAATAGTTLVNEDLHYENVLRGEREPWLMIDPKPLSGDPEFCVIPLLRNRFGELDGPRGLRERVAALVDIGELDAQRAHGWTVFRAVDDWLWSIGQGLAGQAAVCAHIARGLTGT